MGYSSVGNNTQEALLVQYQELRSDLRQNTNKKARLFFRGLVLIAGIYSYAFRINTVGIATIPTVLAILFTVKTQIEIDSYYLSMECIKIENRVDDKNFNWQSEFSRLDPTNRNKLDLLSDTKLNNFFHLPINELIYVVVRFFFFVAYVHAVEYSIFFVPDEISVSMDGVVLFILVVYNSIISIILILALYSKKKVYRETIGDLK